MRKDENEKLKQATVPEKHAVAAAVFGDHRFFVDNLDLSLHRKSKENGSGDLSGDAPANT